MSDLSMEQRRQAQSMVDKMLGADKVNVEGYDVSVPHSISDIQHGHHSPQISRAEAVEAIAASTWARDWARGILSRFTPDFSALPEERQSQLISEWAHKVAEKVARPVP